MLCTLTLTGAGTATAVADEPLPLNSGQCKFPSNPIKETPWSLQRLLVEEMWKSGKGEGVKVAVIDTGVSRQNAQVGVALKGGKSYVRDGDQNVDAVGHGTKVAGIIAARRVKQSGFFGIAPGATIIPYQQTSEEGGGTADKLAEAIDAAVQHGADIINISQGTDADQSLLDKLQAAVTRAEQKERLIVVSAGNGGADGKLRDMYPAAFKNKNVLAVAASDRNDERAPFSQAGAFVDVAAPGVDMVSTVPKGGHCVDQGTSFAAPYAAGVAALLRQKHRDWTPEQIIWHLEETANRPRAGRDVNTGWGVVDPVAAMNNDTTPTGEPVPQRNDDAKKAADTIQPATLTLGESPTDRRTRVASYVIGGAVIAVAGVAGGSVAYRDWRRKTGSTGN